MRVLSAISRYKWRSIWHNIEGVFFFGVNYVPGSPKSEILIEPGGEAIFLLKFGVAKRSGDADKYRKYKFIFI